MKLIVLRLMVILCATVFLNACGGGGGSDGGSNNNGSENTGGNNNGNNNDDDDNEGGSSSLEVTLRGGASTNEEALTKVRSVRQVSCQVITPDLAAVGGACLTPMKISGTVSGVSLGRQTGGPPARLLGGGAGLNNGGVISAQAFDLADPTALAGEDNVQDDTSGDSWNLVSANFTHLDLKFELNGQYWTVRHGFIFEPIISDPVIDECIQGETMEEEPGEGEVDEGDDEEVVEGEDDEEGEGVQGDSVGGYRDDLVENGYLIEGASFQKGDLLFCVKDDESDCAVNEFRWLDMTMGTLVETRPDSPRQIQVIADHETTCAPSSGGQGYDTDLGGFDMFAWVNTPFMLGAQYQENSPVKIYTFSQGDEEAVEGTEMTVYIDYDITQAVFFPNVDEDDLATMEPGEIAEAVYLKPLYIKDNAPEGNGYDPEISVTVNATITGEPPPPPPEPDENSQ